MSWSRCYGSLYSLMQWR
uniref:Uncharacterized protein n=1 Tax=Arundo donax TaxID=35708 RepID=A0A0A9ADV0_ARUDO